MITKITAYGCVCDNCAKDWIDQENGIACYVDELAMKNEINDDEDWTVDNGKHYCSDCFKGFDEDDNVIIDQTRKKT